jgi:hypothetical protein
MLLPRRRRTDRRRWTLLGFLLLLAAIVPPARAQFSPGPLSNAHAELEGTTKCLKCHGLKNGGDMSGQCLACHKGIARLVAERRGIHGREDRKACTTCHVEHLGRDAGLIDRAKLAPETFDHTGTGWPLIGKHREQKCEACHKRDNQELDLLGLEPKPESAHLFIGLKQDCASCHKDPHEGRLGTNCADCHRETSFRDVARDRFAHERTKFPLRGAHAKVECAKCHDPIAAWGKKPPFAACSGCHEDAHAGQALLSGERVDCSACHSEVEFANSTFDRARHRATQFPLEGKHAAVACAKCHPKRPTEIAPARLGSAGVWIRRPFARCEDCHADAHAGQFAARADKGECKACHTVGGWKPALWGVEQHQATAFPLVGRHIQVACKDCHAPAPPGGSRAIATTAAAGTAGMLFKLGASTCLTCHVDPHDGKYATAEAAGGKRACAGCHDLERFRPSLVDDREHGRYNYPLDGAHRAVACVGCHRDLGRPGLKSTLIGRAAVAERITFERRHQDCVECHTDAHDGQLRGPCSRCHGTDAFRPASAFVHDRDASFTLAGAHSKVACERCHPTTVDAAGKRHVTYRPVPIACAKCHADNPGIVDTTKSGSMDAPPRVESPGARSGR